MRNIKLILAYDGTGFEGWQRQLSGRTVQGVVEDAVVRLTGAHSDVHSAGRTDAGVHALGQVAAFRTASALPAGTVMRALNAMLPPDVRVLGAQDAPDGFHPRYAAHSKRYRYLIHISACPSPFAARYVWWLPHALDLSAMREAALELVGTHDFRAFMASGSSVKTTVRTITALTIEEGGAVPFLGMALDGRLISITAEADGFLRHMVRNIAGTLVEAGSGKCPAAQMRRILQSCDRGLAGPTAPGRGLFMEQVYYPD